MSSYICVISFCVCIVYFVVLISFSGLHSNIDSWVCVVIVGGGINLWSFLCGGVISVCINFCNGCVVVLYSILLVGCCCV